MNLSEHPWMEHVETGHRAQLPDLPYWRANGWSPCAGPPPEPDLTRDVLEPASLPDSERSGKPKTAAAKAAKPEPAKGSE